MIHPQQVEHAVEHQDPDFLLRSMPKFAGLRAGPGQGDGEIAERPLACGRWQAADGNDSTSVAIVLAAEVAIQAAQFGVAGDQAVECAALGDFVLELAGESSRARAGERPPVRGGT